TETLSCARSEPNHSAVIRLTIEALEDWWPPTFTPELFFRTRLACWTMAVASHRTRRWTRSSTSMSRSVPGAPAAGGGGSVEIEGASSYAARRAAAWRHSRVPGQAYPPSAAVLLRW